MKAKITAIVNQKGGVGKTTTAVNLAANLAEMDKKILLIDFDPQANASSSISIKEIKATMYDVIQDGYDIQKSIHKTAYPTLHAIPANNDLAGAEIGLHNRDDREFILKKNIDLIKDDYDYIIIDCAPSLGLLTVNALSATDEVLIPVQCEYFALEGLAHLVNTLNLVKENINQNLRIAGIVLTMYDARTTLNKSVVKDTRSYFKELVFETIIPRNIRLAEAPSYGVPISLYNPSSKGCLSYYQLAKEFIYRVN